MYFIKSFVGRAIRVARKNEATHILWVEDDCIIRAGGLQSLVDALEKHKDEVVWGGFYPLNLGGRWACPTNGTTLVCLLDLCFSRLFVFVHGVWEGSMVFRFDDKCHVCRMCAQGARPTRTESLRHRAFAVRLRQARTLKSWCFLMACHATTKLLQQGKMIGRHRASDRDHVNCASKVQ